MPIVRIIGDVHGKFKQYSRLTRNVELSLQIGDFGFRGEHLRHLKYRDSEKHKVCFGNHDDYTFLNAEHSMGNCGSFHGIFCVRGAHSPDYRMRTDGVDWWSNEQMEYSEMLETLDAYAEAKPSIVVTHECPDFMYPAFNRTPHSLNRTAGFLTQLWEAHQPRLWLFGHHHQSIEKQIKGTVFKCLDELEYIDVDVDAW